MLFAYFYLIRVPLLCAGALVALRFVALAEANQASQLLAGLFDVTALGAWGVGLWTALLTAACIVTTDVILRYGAVRFEIGKLPDWMADDQVVKSFAPKGSIDSEGKPTDHRALRKRSLLGVGVYTVSAVVFLTGIYQKAGRGMFLHSLISYFLVYLLLWFLFRGFPGFVPLPSSLKKGFLLRSAHPLRGVVKRLSQWTPEGYQSDSTMPTYHAGTLQGLIFSILVYFLAWIYGKCTDPIPALAGLVLLLTLLCWLLSGITFMFDRFRVPLLLILAIALSYSGIWPEADHTFATKPDAVSLPAPQAIVAGRDRFIVVAASGGGLHASAWTARVLGGLYLELPKDLRKTFANSIRVISPVSGGSLGTIYFVNAYQLDGFGTGDFSAEMMDTNVYQPSQASSLNRIAEKLVFEDVWRTLLPPIPLTADRGRAAEEAWVSAIKDPNSQMRLRLPLKDWAAFATGSAKPTPAVLINATLSDTGERVVLGTSGFGPARRPGRRLFHDLYNRKIDIPLVTAARLSATFPFVSPSARAEGEWAKQERYHFVDGGYYDNYGVSTLVEWLDDALTGAPAFQRVLMIQIRDSKVPVGDAPAKGESGFWAQTVSPLNTLLRFRDAGQLGHGTLETELLGPRSGVEPVMFAWPDDNAPLSWHLTKQEQNRIAAAFDEEGFKAAKRKVCLFLAGDDLKLRQECETSFGAPSAAN